MHVARLGRILKCANTMLTHPSCNPLLPGLASAGAGALAVVVVVVVDVAAAAAVVAVGCWPGPSRSDSVNVLMDSLICIKCAEATTREGSQPTGGRNPFRRCCIRMNSYGFLRLLWNPMGSYGLLWIPMGSYGDRQTDV